MGNTPQLKHDSAREGLTPTTPLCCQLSSFSKGPHHNDHADQPCARKVLPRVAVGCKAVTGVSCAGLLCYHARPPVPSSSNRAATGGHGSYGISENDHSNGACLCIFIGIVDKLRKINHVEHVLCELIIVSPSVHHSKVSASAATQKMERKISLGLK